MKLITAIVSPHKLDDIRDALQDIGIKGITVTEVRGYGRQLGHTELYRGAEYTIEFQPKIKVEVAVAAADEAKSSETILEAASTGKIGDGKIFVTDLEQVIRIRTAEIGESAL